MQYNKITYHKKYWKDVLLSLGIKIIETPKDFKEACQSPGSILVTKCTRNKYDISFGTPKELYRDFGKGDFERMVSFCESHGLRYGVISGKGKGLLFDDEVIPYYDNNPPFYSEQEYQEINDIVKTKAEKRGITSLIIYARSPALNIRVIRFCIGSGIPLFYSTRLFYYKNTFFL